VLSVAEEQEAKLWELRAAASLARLRREQGRRAEARDLLAPVYGWFTEGERLARRRAPARTDGTSWSGCCGSRYSAGWPATRT